jgi:RNA polymerase sigma-70 factor, ECF subfamily
MYDMAARTESGTFTGVNGFNTLLRKYLSGGSLTGLLRRVIADRLSLRPNRNPRPAQFVTGADTICEAIEAVELAGGNMLNWQDLRDAVEQLPQDYRVIFGLHDIYGYKHEEIASRLGISISVSKSQLHDARLRLRTLLFQN